MSNSPAAGPTVAPALWHEGTGTLCAKMMQMAPENTTLQVALAAVGMEAKLAFSQNMLAKKAEELAAENQRRKEEADAQRAHEIAMREKEETARREEKERSDTLTANNQELAVMVFIFHVCLS